MSVWDIPINSDRNGEWCIQLHEDIGKPFIISIECDASFYPLENHYRYARHEGGSTPYTFSHFGFYTTPPGILVGPWPGWRDIQKMPEAYLSMADVRVPGQYQFYGNELITRMLNIAFRVNETNERAAVLHLNDHRIRPVKCSIQSIPDTRAVPIPVSLMEGLQGVHPRLFITPISLDTFRKRALTSHSRFYKRIVELLDYWDMPPIKTQESKLYAGPERLFPEDRVVLSGLQALLFPSNEHCERAIDALLDYVFLTQRDDYEPLRIDTQSGEVLFTLCIGYDWLYHYLGDQQRSIVETQLKEVMRICLDHLPETRTDYAQAHFLGCGLGLLTYAFLRWENDVDGHGIAARMRNVLERIINLLPADGFYPHGINLWSYEHGFLLRWLELFLCCTGENLWERSSYWKNASRFRASVTSSDGMYAITSGDPQYRVGGDAWCHDLIATRTKSTEAQSLANSLRNLPVYGVDYRHAPSRRIAWEFLFHDTDIQTLERKDGIQVFDDGGQVSLRHGERLVVVRSGAPLGKSRRAGGELGAYGHSDPCNGSVLVYDAGDFILSGPGPSYYRATSLQNVITINGKGQIGDRCVWLPDVFPTENLPDGIGLIQCNGATSIEMDLAKCYLPDLQMKYYKRYLLILNEVIVGVDDVRIEHPDEIELNFHTWCNINQITNTQWIIRGHNVNYNLYTHAMMDFKTESGLTEFIPAYTHDGTRDSFIRYSICSSFATYFWFLGKSLKEVTIEEQLESTVLRWNDSQAVFDGRSLIMVR